MMELAKTQAARRAIAEAVRVDEVKDIRDKAEAVRLYAKRAGLGKGMENDAAEIVIRAERRMGQILADMKKNKGTLLRGNVVSPRETTPKLSDLGVSKKQSSQSQFLSSIPEKAFEIAVANATKTEDLSTGGIISQFKKDIRHGSNALRIAALSEKNVPIPDTPTKYNIIYADPPWRYEHPISGTRKVENHYPTMTDEEICALKVCDLCAEDAVLFLWVTAPMSKRGHRVMEAWGFEYRTQMVWIKPSIGTGHWVRQRHELLYIGVRGNIPTPAPENKPDSVLESPRLGHSEKPEEMYAIIEKMYPGLPRIELFAREARDGWERWGNQA